MRSDFIEFIKAPIHRLQKAALWKAQYPSWIPAYAGHTEAMPAIETPFAPESVLVRLRGTSRSNLDEYFRLYQYGKAQPQAQAFAYRSHWFGQIAEHYASTAVTIGTFLIPRGPYHAELNKPAEAQGSLKLLERPIKGVVPWTRSFYCYEILSSAMWQNLRTFLQHCQLPHQLSDWSGQMDIE